jgi:hypothetical protein
VPGPGDPDGSGKAKLTLTTREDKHGGRICSKITFQGIEPPVRGAPLRGLFRATAIIGLTAPGASSPVDDCRKFQRSFVTFIAEHPRRFYVVLINSTFLTGAIRGQLRPRS